VKIPRSEKSNSTRIIRTVPLTITRLKELSHFIKITQVCSACKLNYNSLKTKLYKSRPLTQDESEKIQNYLDSIGVLVSFEEFGVS